MNQNTWNKLTSTEQAEVRSMTISFIKKVQKSDAFDGFEFGRKYTVSKNNDYFIISEISTGSQFGDFKSKSKAVMNALLGDAIGNYGR